MGPSAIVVLQRPDRPMVYLDHWVFRKFAQETDLGARFTKAAPWPCRG